jgi:hypothetical protein
VSKEFELRVKAFWVDTPAVVVVKEINRRSDLPKWENCPKDHIYVGISRRKSGDKVTVVKHKLEGIFGLNCKAEELSEDDMHSIGLTPCYKSMICVQCGDFSTRMNIGSICDDCTSVERKKS